jgi:hypothetical protein
MDRLTTPGITVKLWTKAKKPFAVSFQFFICHPKGDTRQRQTKGVMCYILHFVQVMGAHSVWFQNDYLCYYGCLQETNGDLQPTGQSKLDHIFHNQKNKAHGANQSFPSVLNTVSWTTKLQGNHLNGLSCNFQLPYL